MTLSFSRGRTHLLMTTIPGKLKDWRGEGGDEDEEEGEIEEGGPPAGDRREERQGEKEGGHDGR